MKYRHIILEKSNYVARITLNRPEKLNALSREMTDELWHALNAIAESDDIKVVVFKGAGRAFSAGADLTQASAVYGWNEPKSGEDVPRPSKRSRLKFDRHAFYEDVQRMLLYPKLTIAEIHGYCLGAAFNLFLHCDLIVAADDSQMGFPEEKLGTAGLTISPLLVLRCGLTHALDLSITGRMVDGQEAARIGLINRSVPRERLDDEVNKLAESLAQYPRHGIEMGKLSRHFVYGIMGIIQGLTPAYVMHALQTDMSFEADEFNFFKPWLEKGVKAATHIRREAEGKPKDGGIDKQTT